MNRLRTNPAELRKKKQRRLIIASFLLLVVFVFSIFMIRHYEVKRSDVFSSVSFIKKVIEPKKDRNELKSRVESIIAKYPGLNISVGYGDLESTEITSAGSNQKFIAASTIKILVAADYLHQVEQGKHTLNETVGGYTARWQLKQMIQKSNNDSWYAFNDILGYRQESEYAKSIGISYDSNENAISAGDMALFLKKLYNRELLNEENTSLMFYYMQNTNNEEMIPAALPEVKVMHKYGAIDTKLHDVAIVEGGKPYFLAIYTDMTKTLTIQKRIEAIKEITRAANAYASK
jgi:beta-lactamase class A